MEIKAYIKGSKKELEETAGHLQNLPFIVSIGGIYQSQANQDIYFMTLDTYDLPPDQYKKTWKQITKDRKTEEKQNLFYVLLPMTGQPIIYKSTPERPFSLSLQAEHEGRLPVFKTEKAARKYITDRTNKVPEIREPAILPHRRPQ